MLKIYTLTAQDVAGPWSQNVGEDFVKMSKQPALGYTSPKEMLAERFHMDEQLLTTLNPQRRPVQGRDADRGGRPPARPRCPR